MRLQLLSDVNHLPRETRKVFIVRFLSENLVKSLLNRCPRLDLVILTRTARKNTSKEALTLLKKNKVGISVDYFKAGRPVKLSRKQVAEILKLREQGFTYRELASKFGVGASTICRIFKGSTKFVRWKEDYEGNTKIVWMVTRDADPDGRRLADNHYSRKTIGATHFCGPGEKLVLITPDKKALFVWRKNKYRQDGQKGVECAIFRNEGAGLSSELIKEAVRLARKKWPSERLFTYVCPSAVKSTQPGFCFRQAGWKIVARNMSKNMSKNLLLLRAPR